MATIRASFRSRVAFCVLVIACFLAVLFVFRSEGKQEWKRFQEAYHGRLVERLALELDKARKAGDPAATKKWSDLLARAEADQGPRIEQIFLPDAGVRDLCRTCHLGLENLLFKDEDNPLRTHPGEILRHHKPDRFGCTLCHQGQGIGLTVDKAHGYEENWPRPRVPLRYLQGLCLGCHESPFGLEGAEKAEQGQALFVEHGCVGCHEARGLVGLPRMATPFDGIGSKIPDARWIYEWIKDPAALRPRTRMPTFRLETEEILHVTAYLVSRRDLPKPLVAYRSRRGSARRGKELFREKGCIACHSDRRDEACVDDRVPNLGDGGLKLSGPWVATWLEQPRELSPDTAMPRLMLEEGERRDLARYVTSLKPPDVMALMDKAPPNLPEGGDPVQGERIVQVMGCYGCHRVREMERLPPVGVAVGDVAGKRLDELPFGSSQVPRTKWDWLFNKIKKPALYETEDMPLKMPDYRIEDPEVEALTTYYLHNAYYEIPEVYLCRSDAATKARQKGAWILSHYHCNGCHQLQEGAKPRIERYLALRSLVPPRLVAEAERVQPQWFFQYLSRPVSLRPWLKIRMPEFNWTYEDRRDLIASFRWDLDPGVRQAVKVPYVQLPVREDYDPEVLEMGEYRLGTDKCMQCHPVSFDGSLPEGVKLEDLSINLMLAKRRLRFEWIKDFLRDPDRYAGRGTKMPFVYYTPDGVPRVPDPEMWIEYVSLYLMFMDEVPEIPEEKSIEEVRPGSEIDWTQYE